jgi:flagellar motor switch protein FliN/FliY
MSLILAKESRGSDIIDKEYQEGFFQFIALETLLAFNRTEYDKNLAPHILDTAEAPSEGAPCLNITIDCNGTPFVGRLILSEEFRHSWKDRYTQHKMDVTISSELAQKLQVIVHLEAGRTALTAKEWESVHPGDYIPLDACSFEPGTDKGRVIITFHGQQLFRAKVKQGNIKILEFPLYQEVDTTMGTDDEDDEDEMTDEYFDESELEDESGEFHEDDDHLDEFETDEHTLEEEHSTAPSPTKPEAVATPKQTAQAAVVSPESIQMTVVVEVGRLQMSIQKLMELQPGNLLELDVHPENGVDLVINGKCIGRGELLRIGETLGVRVLDKG